VDSSIKNTLLVHSDAPGLVITLPNIHSSAFTRNLQRIRGVLHDVKFFLGPFIACYCKLSTMMDSCLSLLRKCRGCLRHGEASMGRSLIPEANAESSSELLYTFMINRLV
jgi:hypothetical protein